MMMFWIVVDGGGEVVGDSGAFGMSERINWKMPNIATSIKEAPPSPARIVNSLSDHEALIIPTCVNTQVMPPAMKKRSVKKTRI